MVSTVLSRGVILAYGMETYVRSRRDSLSDGLRMQITTLASFADLASSEKRQPGKKLALCERCLVLCFSLVLVFARLVVVDCLGLVHGPIWFAVVSRVSLGLAGLLWSLSLKENIQGAKSDCQGRRHPSLDRRTSSYKCYQESGLRFGHVSAKLYQL